MQPKTSFIVKFSWLILCLLLSMGLLPVPVQAQTDEDELTRFELGLDHFWNTDYADAIGEFTTALDEETNLYEIYVYRGASYVGTMEYDLALADFDAAAVIDIEEPLLYALRANYYLALEDFESAQADVDAAIGLDEEFALAYLSWGNLLARQGEAREAMEQYDQALELASPYDEELTPDYHAMVYMRKALAAEQASAYESALENVDFAIAQDDTHPWFYMVGGIYADILGEYELAQDYLDRAIELSPDYRQAYIERGFGKIQLGEFEEAIEDFTAGLTLGDGDNLGAIAHGNRGYAYDQLGDSGNAMADYVAAFQIDPTLEWVNTNANNHIAVNYAILEDDFADGTWIPDFINGGRTNPFGGYFEINYPCGALGLTASFHNVHRYDLKDTEDTFFSQAIFYYPDAELADTDFAILDEILGECELIEEISLSEDDFADSAVLYSLQSENTEGDIIGQLYSLYYRRGNVIEVLTYGASGADASNLDSALVETLAALTLERIEAAPSFIQ